MDNKVIIFADVPASLLRNLAASVCLKAFEDLRSGQVERALDAVLWLTSEDFEDWLAYAD